MAGQDMVGDVENRSSRGDEATFDDPAAAEIGLERLPVGVAVLAQFAQDFVQLLQSPFDRFPSKDHGAILRRRYSRWRRRSAWVSRYRWSVASSKRSCVSSSAT